MSGLPAEDRLAIHDLLVRYARAVDTLELDLLDDVFTPDAEIDYSAAGGIAGRYPEIKTWLGQVLPAFEVRQHLLTNTTVTATGEGASATTYLHNPMGYRDRDGRLAVMQIGGYYHDRLVRTPGGWRIAARREEQVWIVGELPGRR